MEHQPAANAPANNAKIWSTSSAEGARTHQGVLARTQHEGQQKLVQVEKETVLKKMKEQQKFLCSCAVCGRKRSAIEEELEVLYDAYYDELEEYANHQQRWPAVVAQFLHHLGPDPSLAALLSMLLEPSSVVTHLLATSLLTQLATPGTRILTRTDAKHLFTQNPPTAMTTTSWTMMRIR